MRTGLCISLALSCVALAATAAEPKRLPRSEAFLGIHFDFHANKTSTNVGARTTAQMVETIIDLVHPDYIQCDCKGHPGYSSYPTKVGNPAPGIVGDPLRIWRDVTRERGVALVMHYSGLYDAHAVRAHPEWAALGADGKPHERATSPFGPYADRLLIPQLRELAGAYGVDGAWVDGECWAAAPDWGEAASAAFRNKYHADPPHKRGEPLWNEWLDFNREAFRTYLRHYVDTLKASDPNFEVISNWAFSDHMPEPVSANIAALSGDFSSANSVNSARFTARCFENQGKRWDLMAWSFNNKTRQQKPAIALRQEAAVVLALGGGFSAYYKQERDGAVDTNELNVMSEVAKFCRERQPFCHRSEPIPQVAVLYSRAAHYRNSGALFHPYGDPELTLAQRALTALLSAQRSVQVVSEHHLAGKMAQWPLIVVAGWSYLEPQFRDELASYANGGGKLLLVGDGPAKLFVKEIETAGPTASGASNVHKLGGGAIGAVAADADIEPMAKRLFPAPLVQVSGSRDVDLCVRRLKGKLMINLVNTSGDHANKENKIVQEVPAIGPLSLSIRTATPPRGITVQPGGTKLDVTWQDGIARTMLPRLELHSIVQVDE